MTLTEDEHKKIFIVQNVAQMNQCIEMFNNVIYSIENYSDLDTQKTLYNFRAFIRNLHVGLKIDINKSKYKDFNEMVFDNIRINIIKSELKIHLKMMVDDLIVLINSVKMKSDI